MTAPLMRTPQKRYLSLGKRVQLHKSALMRWEMFHQREALMDGLSTLRHVFAISDREEDMAYVINELFMQQRAGLRSSLISPKSKIEVKTPQALGRSMLIKRMVLSHLMEVCLNIRPHIAAFRGQLALRSAVWRDAKWRKVLGAQGG